MNQIRQMLIPWNADASAARILVYTGIPSSPMEVLNV